MANKDGHRRFGSIRKLPSGRFQIRYPVPMDSSEPARRPTRPRATPIGRSP